MINKIAFRRQSGRPLTKRTDRHSDTFAPVTLTLLFPLQLLKRNKPYLKGNVYLLDAIIVQWVTILSISGLYSHTKKTSECLCAGSDKKRHVAPECLLQTHSTFSKSVMVSMRVSKLGLIDLIFVEAVVKINGAYCRDMLLVQAGTQQTSRCIHSRSNHPCVYSRILVPRSFNQTPWAAALTALNAPYFVIGL